MNKYSIRWKKSATKELKLLPKSVVTLILEKIETISVEPRNAVGISKLSSLENHYRLRIGDYRIIFSIFDKILTIEIIKIGHRKDVYKSL